MVTCTGSAEQPSVWSIAGTTMRAQVAVCRMQMRATMLRTRMRMSALVWPSAAKSSGRKAWQRIRRYARWRKRKAPKRGAKRLKRKNGIRMVSEFRLKGIQIPAKPAEFF